MGRKTRSTNFVSFSVIDFSFRLRDYYYKWIYESSYIWTAENDEDMFDHRSYTLNLSSWEIKAWKKFRPERDSNPSSSWLLLKTMINLLLFWNKSYGRLRLTHSRNLQKLTNEFWKRQIIGIFKYSSKIGRWLVLFKSSEKAEHRFLCDRKVEF